MKHSKEIIGLLNKTISCYLSNPILEDHDKNSLVKVIDLVTKDIFTFKFDMSSNNYISNEELQNRLSNLNETKISQKKEGAYFTPTDVTEFIISNTFKHFLHKENEYGNSVEDISIKLLPENLNSIEQRRIINASIIDPTCGNGEFLLNALKMKMRIYHVIKKNNSDFKREMMHAIFSTLYGNDMDEMSLLITKIRLLLQFVEESLRIGSSIDYLDLLYILTTNFTGYNFVNESTLLDEKYDIILGNPPFIEYRNIEYNTINNFGNIYADCLKNSIDILKDGGVLGFIVPISFVSTHRMSSIRNYVFSNTDDNIILSFADRPDSLFNRAHQKLNIIFLKKSKEINQEWLFTSNYNYWYAKERDRLFNKVQIIRNNFSESGFIPKLGLSIEKEIYSKIFTSELAFFESSREVKLYDILTPNINDQNLSEIYINMRVGFWVKVLFEQPISKEFKKFKVPEYLQYYIYAILNSSLFFWYWTVLSDGWHITNKELNHFKIVISEDHIKDLNKFALELMDKLEETKEYVGTKQTMYEYKHRKCKDVIDKIDDVLKEIYSLSNEELEYIKNFALTYRKGNGNV